MIMVLTASVKMAADMVYYLGSFRLTHLAVFPLAVFCPTHLAVFSFRPFSSKRLQI